MARDFIEFDRVRDRILVALSRETSLRKPDWVDVYVVMAKHGISGENWLIGSVIDDLERGDFVKKRPENNNELLLRSRGLREASKVIEMSSWYGRLLKEDITKIMSLGISLISLAVSLTALYVNYYKKS